MAEFTTKQRERLADKGQAMPGGRYPIRGREDLDDAIAAVGRAKGGAAGRAKVRRYIMRRAKALGLTDRIPDTWAADGSLKPSGGRTS